MIGSIGRRLRLVLRQPDGPALVRDSEANILPEVEFVAYAEDGRLSGRIRLDSTRLTDMLNAHDEYQLEDVLAEHLTHDGTLVMAKLVVRRDELLLVHASGPRGDRELRRRTIARGMAVGIGQYLVTGDVHALAGVDPIVFFRRRSSMVPLTDAVIEYRGPHGQVREHVDTVVVNRDLVDWVDAAEPGGVARDMPQIYTNRADTPTS